MQADNEVATKKVLLNSIPQGLKERPQWVVWRYESRDGKPKPTKVPYQAAKMGQKASVTDARTWSYFDKACNALASGSFDGIGFVLTLDDPFVGVDLDHCRDAITGVIEPWAINIVEQLNSYSEISPSQTGVRIFVLGSLPPIGRKKGRLEFYEDERYLTVTGNHLAGTPRTIEDRHAILQEVHATHFALPHQNTHESGPRAITADDETQLARMFHSKNGAKIKKLWNGDWSDDYPSQSEADSALCCHLAYWFGRDKERMDRLFRGSKLMREKWDSRRRQGTYGQRVIDAVCGICTKVYEEKVEDGLVKWLADGIQQEASFAKDAGGRLYVFEDGVYSAAAGEEFVGRQVKQRLIAAKNAKLWSTRRVSEVAAWISVDADKLWECPPVTTLNVRNGLLDIGTGELRPHDPNFLASIQLPVIYDPSAKCPRWDAFVDKVFPEDCRELAYEIPGWLMVPDMSIQQSVLLIGPGADGKSTYLSAVTAFLGLTNVAALTLQQLEADKFASARLMGKLANVCADLPSRHLAGTSMFKAITGGDAVSAERKFQHAFEFRPFCRFVFSANHYPQSPDSSTAFLRRWVVIPFERTFAPHEQRSRTELDAELADPHELSGVLNRALAALRGMRTRRGFTISETMKKAALEFVEVTDPISAWLDRFTVIDPMSRVTKKDLAIAFNAAAQEEGRPPSSAKAFYAAVRRLRPQIIESKKENEEVFIGIRLKLVGF